MPGRASRFAPCAVSFAGPLTKGFYQASDGQDRTNIVDLKFIQSNPDSETFFQSGKQIDERHGIQDSRCQQVRPRA